MNIKINNASNKPIYQQLFDKISSQILKGELEGGFCLPPIRTAAVELRVSVITVKKAWEELERQGFIYTMVGRGCFISDLSLNDLSQKRRAIITEKMKKDIEYYKELGMTIDEIIELLKSMY